MIVRHACIGNVTTPRARGVSMVGVCVPACLCNNKALRCKSEKENDRGARHPLPMRVSRDECVLRRRKTPLSARARSGPLIAGMRQVQCPQRPIDSAHPPLRMPLGPPSTSSRSRTPRDSSGVTQKVEGVKAREMVIQGTPRVQHDLIGRRGCKLLHPVLTASGYCPESVICCTLIRDSAA